MSPLTILLGAIAIVALVVAVVALTGDEEEPGPTGTGSERKEGRQRQPEQAAGDELIRLELRVRAPVEVCLLGAGQQALIDGQLLAAGTRDAFASERFQLRFPTGYDRDQVVLELNGEAAKLPRIEGPARLKITPPERVRQASPPGERCP